MALSIRSPRAEALARELASKTGENMTDAIIQALEERLARVSEASSSLVDDLLAIAAECSALPDLDTRSADEILGYGPDGTFG